MTSLRAIGTQIQAQTNRHTHTHTQSHSLFMIKFVRFCRIGNLLLSWTNNEPQNQRTQNEPTMSLNANLFIQMHLLTLYHCVLTIDTLF